MTLIVRPARVEDAETIAGFNRAMAVETEDLALQPERVSAGVRAVFADSTKGFYLVAEAEGTPVGQVMVTPEWSDWRDGYFWWVQSVYVVPAARRRGVFRALLEALESRAAADPQVRGLRLYVHRHNANARRVYVRLGWRRADHDLYERDLTPGGTSAANAGSP